MKKMNTIVTIVLSMALFITGCGVESTMGSLPEAEKETYSPSQSMSSADTQEDDNELFIMGDVSKGFDPSLGDYECGYVNCTGHKQTDKNVDGYAVCVPETFYCGEESCTGHENADEVCDTSFPIKLTFVGDCMLATSKGQSYEGSLNWYAANKEPSYFFEKVYDVFSSDDFTIVNLENVFTDKALKERDKGHSVMYWYRGPSSNANILTASSVEMVSLSNNHYNDYGSQGQADTRAALEAVNMPYGTDDKIVYFEKNGYKIAVICHGLWGEWQADAIVNKIKEAETQSDFQIVYYHGGTERLHAPEDWKVRASRKLVDNGADLVIGNHPHVLQPRETYNGVEIVYSLGNFCFGGNRKPENRTIVYTFELIVDKNEVISTKSDIIPYYVYTGTTNNWQPAPIEDEAQKNIVLEFMEGKRDLPY